jgi:hypothetical protein
MTKMLALSILAILAWDAFSPTNQSMTTTLALRTTAIKLLESSITMQSVAMTVTHAQLIPATLQKDANTLLSTSQQRMQLTATNAKFGSALLTRDSTKNLLIATIMTFAQLILAIPPPELVPTLLSFALMRTNAQKILAIPKKDVSMHQRTAMTAMHAQSTLAIFLLVASSHLLFVTITTLAPRTLALQENASTLQSQSQLQQIFAPSLLAIARTDFTLIQRIVMTKTLALSTHATPPPEIANTLERIVTTTMLAPPTLATKLPENAQTLQLFALTSMLAQKTLAIL